MNHKSGLKKYSLGFAFSLSLTFIAYFLVSSNLLHSLFLTAALLGLALVQLLVQLIFFLHLLEEGKPRWNLLIFISTISIILLIIVGSIWIINNLNYRHFTPTQMENYVKSQEGGF